MMKAEVKGFVYSDFDERTWWPEHEDDFSFWLQVFVGPEGQVGHERIELQVTTPKWLHRNLSTADVLIGWGAVVVQTYDPLEIEQAVRRFVAQWEADTWRELVLKVARLGIWEFDERPPGARLYPRGSASV